MEISTEIGDFPDFYGSTTDYGLRLYDLAILPTTGAPCARNALTIVATASANIADSLISGGQFVATNPDGYAIYHENEGNNGLFTLRIHDIKARGGLKLIRLGDTCEIKRGTISGGGSNPAVYVSTLDPQNITDTAAQFIMEAVNINAMAGAVVLENAATFRLSNLNIELRNRHEGGAAHYGKYAVTLNNCGNVAGVPGRSARQYSGSIIEAVKILPADGATYDTSSGAGALHIQNSRGIMVLGGAYGSSQILDPNGSPADNGVCIKIENSSNTIIDGPDLQLTVNSIGVHNLNSSETEVRGYTTNLNYAGSREFVEAGRGTIGRAAALPTPAGYVAPGGGQLTFVKNAAGVVSVSGYIKPEAGAATVPAYFTLATLPDGYAPPAGDIAVFSMSVEISPAAADTGPTIRELTGRAYDDGTGRTVLQINSWSNPLSPTLGIETENVRGIFVKAGWTSPRRR